MMSSVTLFVLIYILVVTISGIGLASIFPDGKNRTKGDIVAGLSIVIASGVVLVLVMIMHDDYRDCSSLCTDDAFSSAAYRAYVLGDSSCYDE